MNDGFSSQYFINAASVLLVMQNNFNTIHYNYLRNLI